jgi:hypothetical protein
MSIVTGQKRYQIPLPGTPGRAGEQEQYYFRPGRTGWPPIRLDRPPGLGCGGKPPPPATRPATGAPRRCQGRLDGHRAVASPGVVPGELDSRQPQLRHVDGGDQASAPQTGDADCGLRVDQASTTPGRWPSSPRPMTGGGPFRHPGRTRTRRRTGRSCPVTSGGWDGGEPRLSEAGPPLRVSGGPGVKLPRRRGGQAAITPWRAGPWAPEA